MSAGSEVHYADRYALQHLYRTGILETAFLKFLIDEMDGETHDIEVRTFHLRAGYIAYPFLNTISTGLVKRSVFLYIVTNLFVGKVSESDIGSIYDRRDIETSI